MGLKFVNFKENDLEKMETDHDDDIYIAPPNIGGRPKTSINDISDRQQTRRMKHVLETLEQFCTDEQIDMYRLLGLAGRKYFSTSGEHYDYDKAKVFNEIYDGNDPYERRALTVEEASFIKESLEIGTQKYKNLKTFLKPHIHLPHPDKLRELKNDLGFYLENAHNSLPPTI